ncbi:MAG: methyltransferase [Candidatus Gottesmanbacteria bacterium GW2011_GWA2_43_14]|uniref:Methyltransferase n=1 Tax=Candidatus Gottesmanbacteria bacterium GW2011_GWA2_43_14 TaxID=1618443 RepID=A0A0G1DJU6_9BACT|nr:MAG: methyltransferase [Candidatus Gottesmanbacteria bacterium GW2011_GWA2_43_14]
MNREGQSAIKNHFDRLYKQGITPWKNHPPSSLLIRFFALLKASAAKARLLDLGCGDGWLTIEAARVSIAAWGIDASETAIERAEKSAKSTGIASKTKFAAGDALDLPYEDNFFDGMIDRGLFHHILTENRQLYFDNILRVLKKDALVYLAVFSENNPEGIGQRFTGKDIAALFGRYFRIIQTEKDKLPTTAPAHLLHLILKKTQ